MLVLIWIHVHWLCATVKRRKSVHSQTSVSCQTQTLAKLLDDLIGAGEQHRGHVQPERRTAEGDSLAITIPRTEAAVIKHFQARMPYGLILPDEELRELHIADRKGTRIVSGASPCASTRSTAEAYRLPWLRL
jgi:hypothetical protein